MSAQISLEELKATLQRLDDYEFEHLVAHLWDHRGWETEVSSQSSDRGIDVRAVRNDNGFETTAAIQVKRHQAGNSVGSPDIQQYASLRRQESVDLVVVVTTSTFTKQAKDLAEELNVKLIDGDGLASQLQSIGSEDIMGSLGSAEESPLPELKRAMQKINKSDKTFQWWGKDQTPWEVGGDRWKGVAMSSVALLCGPIAVLFRPESSLGRGLALIYLLSYLALSVSIYRDSSLLHERGIWSPWWSVYVFGGAIVFGLTFLGFLVGIIYLTRRVWLLGYPS